MSTPSLIEISLSGLDERIAQSVIELFDRWGRGGAVIEDSIGEEPRNTVKTYLLSEDDESLRQIEIGLALLNQARLPLDPKATWQGERVAQQSLPEPRVRFLAETDWAEDWKSRYDVLHIGRRLVVKPTWRDYAPQAGKLVIALDPGMAFGSGLHPTSQLCLEAMEDYLIPGDTLLDVGTGSGILAIAGAVLGASRVLALDTDQLAVRVARENVAINQVTSVVQVEIGTLETADPRPQVSDLVVANILAETIIELLPALAARLSAPGVLITSGIIADRAEAVCGALHENRLSLIEQRVKGEWVALIAGNTQAADHDL